MPLAVPVAMPMLRSGNACHQRLMRSTSVVAAYNPVSQAGSLPRGWQGKTASPFCASCNAAACRLVIVCSAKFRPRAGCAAQGLLLLDGDGVVQLLRKRHRCSLHADGLRHLASEVNEVGVKPNLLARPGLIVLAAARRSDQHRVGLVQDQRFDASIAKVNDRLLNFFAVLFELFRRHAIDSDVDLLAAEVGGTKVVARKKIRNVCHAHYPFIAVAGRTTLLSASPVSGLRFTQMSSLGLPNWRTVSARKWKVGVLIQPRWRPQTHMIEALCGPRPVPITASCPLQRGHGSGSLMARPTRVVSSTGAAPNMASCAFMPTSPVR